MSGAAIGAASIAAALRQAGLGDIPVESAARFESYLSLLLRWNMRMNLTAARTPEAVVHRHLFECVQCARLLPGLSTLLDFGSGSGLPGIPIAVCRPDVHVTLAESQYKKAAFLREVVRVLELDVEVFGGRVEEMPSDRTFEAVSLRAVDRMVRACGAARARLAGGGWVVLFSTETEKDTLKVALPNVIWRREASSLSLDRGVILLGQAS